MQDIILREILRVYRGHVEFDHIRHIADRYKIASFRQWEGVTPEDRQDIEITYANTATLRDWIDKLWSIDADDKTKLLLNPSLPEGDSSKVEWDNKGKRITTSWFKYLTRVCKPAKPYYTDEMLQTVQAKLQTRFDLSPYSYEIVRGNDVKRNYRVTPSCMTSCMEALDLYVENPNKVGLVVINRDNVPMGRALLWTLDDGSMFQDRIYPSDGGSHITYMEGEAKKNGWHYKIDHCIEGDWVGPEVMVATLEDVGAYPYMDTLRYGTIEGGSIICATDGGDFLLDSTENAPPGAEATILGHDIYGDTVFEHEEEWYVWSDYHECFVHLDDVVSTETGDDYFHSDHLPEYIKLTLDGVWIDVRYDDSYVLITRGFFSGEWVYVEDVVSPPNNPDVWIHVDYQTEDSERHPHDWEEEEEEGE